MTIRKGVNLLNKDKYYTVIYFTTCVNPLWASAHQDFRQGGVSDDIEPTKTTPPPPSTYPLALPSSGELPI